MTTENLVRRAGCMLAPLLLFAAPVLAATDSAQSSAAGRDAFAFAPEGSMFFLGIEGDYRGYGLDEIRSLLEEQGLEVVGDPLRGTVSADRRVWAIRVTEEDPGKLVRKLKKPLRKVGFQAKRLRGSVFAPLGRDWSRVLPSASRVLAGSDSKVWTTWAPRGRAAASCFWVFHDTSLTRKKLERELKDAGLSTTPFHQEFVLTPPPGVGDAVALMTSLEPVAAEQLDLLSLSLREGSLVLDVYLQDVDEMLIVPRGTKLCACPPEISALVAQTQVGSEEEPWKLAIPTEFVPFVDPR